MKDIAGVERGKCNSCACTEYRSHSGGGSLRCDYCNHTPVEHVKVVELGACLKCGKDNCDKYMAEDAHSDGDCQYCGCDANSHAGAEPALVRSNPRAQATTSPTPRALVPVSSASVVGSGGSGRSLGGTNVADFTPSSGGVQPKMSESGQPTQSYVMGTCVFPGCPYPKRIEGNYMHDYCSRTCARKHAALGRQKPQPVQPQLTAHPPSNSPEPSPGRILVQSHQRTLVTQRPGEPPRATTVTLIRATKVPETGRVPEGPEMGRGPLPSVQICKKCNKRPANRGHTWCQECYSSS